MKKTKRTRRIFIALTLSASMFAMTLPIVATESTSEYGEGYVAPKESPSQAAEESNEKLLTATTYPSSYDAREQSWWKGVEIKNQRSTGLCWAFATCTATEISYMKESGKSAVSLSPGHLGYFSYNRSATFKDPLGNTLGDFVGEESEWYNTGGNAETALFVLAGREGYATSTTAPYTNWVGSPSSFSGYSDSIAYTDYLVLENADYHYSSSGFSKDTIKALLTKYGAVFCSLTGIQSEYCQYKNGYYNLNYDGTGYATHAVTMIGWDDNYSKDNFPTAHKPKNNGAWLIQNSWGTSYQYVWVSYEDKCINNDITGFDVREATTGEVVFQHDGTGSWGWKYLNKNDKVANTYAVPTGKSYVLKEVGFGELNSSTKSYNISIYTNLPNRTKPIPSGATAAVSFDVTTTCEGYHTFALPSEVKLEGGTNYSIVITAKSAGTYIAADKEDYTGSVHFVPTTNAGDSFYYETLLGKWDDLSEESTPITTRIKGIAVEQSGINGTVTGYDGSNLSVKLKNASGTTVATSTSSSFKFDGKAAGQYTLTVSGGGDYIDRDYTFTYDGSYISKSLEIRQRGDVTCDGIRSAADVTKLARHIADVSKITDSYVLKLADTDKSGSAKAADVTYLARYVARIISSL